jgi:hypothetical protein
VQCGKSAAKLKEPVMFDLYDILAIASILLTAFICAAISWYDSRAWRRRDAVRDAWKALALALEVELECYEDYADDVPNEGCGTRSKRLAKLARELENAADARWKAFDNLITLGERDD